MKHKYMTPTLCQESLPVNIIFFRLHWMNCSGTRLTSRFWCAPGPTLPPPPWVPWVQWQVPPRRQQTLALSENNNYSNLVNKLVLILYYLLLCSTQMLASLCFERILMFGLGPYPYIPWVGCWESRPIYFRPDAPCWCRNLDIVTQVLRKFSCHNSTSQKKQLRRNAISYSCLFPWGPRMGNGILHCFLAFLYDKPSINPFFFCFLVLIKVGDVNLRLNFFIIINHHVKKGEPHLYEFGHFQEISTQVHVPDQESHLIPGYEAKLPMTVSTAVCMV